MNKKIIITGGLGYIGRVLQEECKKEGIETIVIDNNLYGLAEKDAKFINCDLLDKERLDHILSTQREEADTIVNLAAIVGDPACLVNTRQALEVNCVGTRNLIEVANKHKYKIIHASTCSLYGSENCSPDKPLTEESPVFPIDFYGQTKYQQERFVRELANDYCVFRLGTAYGLSPRMRYDLVINLFSAKAANGETLSVFGGNQYRPFSHTRDISRAFIFAYKNNLSGIFNLAGDNETIKGIAEAFETKYGTKVEKTNLIEDPRNYIASSKKLIDAGFKFEYNIEKGIAEIIDFSRGIDYKEKKYDDKKLMEINQIDESRILITGGSGRLGRACKKIFKKAQYPNREEMSLASNDSIDSYFNNHKIDTVIHLAAMTGIPNCENDKEQAYDINVNGIRRLLDASKKYGIKHFIYLDTACVFPGTDDETMENEDSLPYPKHYYGLTKYIAEEIAKTYNNPEMMVTITRTNFTSMPWEYPKAFTDRYGTYLFAQGVAKGLRDIVKEKPQQPIIHICGDKKISMYDYAVAGGSKVEPMTLEDYKGTPLTKNMSITSKYWKLYRLEDSDFRDE
jgi:nucleoside-diphosphate-sugar epimerase